ncbi:hypothetical protein [Scatolibacter rhodanostii]|uniref:hypothetical protein n=1 Tax=Scatolibacter rhodanostii TaxID=2014781 RepID=UPI000C08884E|nr:hypothetical protein [Scatolibacter rhodanostii]
MLKLGFIDYYLDEFHANNYPEWIKSISSGEIEVKYAYAKIDSPKGGLTTDQWCEKYGIERVYSIEELVEKSDILNVLSPDNPEMHEELCEIPLKSGKRTYIDKTFADTKEIAERIFAVAEKYNTPCFSSSALRFAEEYQSIDKATLMNVTSIGPGPLDVYSIHQIEPLIALMGANVKRLQYIGTEKWPAVVIEWEDGRRATFSHHGWECPFTMVTDDESGKTNVVEIKSEYFVSFIHEMVDFFLTGRSKVPHQDTIAVMAVREAAIKASLKPGEWFDI